MVDDDWREYCVEAESSPIVMSDEHEAAL